MGVGVRRTARAINVTVLAVALLPAVAGCRSSVSLNREVVVVFKPGSTQADRDRVRAACATATPHASPVPVGPGTLKSSRVNDVRFRVDTAGDAELNKLYACLIADPSVRGVSLPGVG